MHKKKGSASVIIAEDAQFMRRLLQDILIKAGYTIVGEAEDGEAAIDLYKKFHPDVVTMDIIMPKVDGLQAIAKIREYDHGARIVVISALGQQSMVIRALRAGAVDFIVKPFNEKHVRDVLRKALHP